MPGSNRNPDDHRDIQTVPVYRLMVDTLGNEVDGAKGQVRDYYVVARDLPAAKERLEGICAGAIKVLGGECVGDGV